MNKKLIYKNIYTIVIALLSGILLWYILKMTGISLSTFSVDGVENLLKENKDTSLIIYMFLNLIRPFFMIIPAWIFAVVSGVIYGPICGIVYSLIGLFISSISAFYLGRILGRDFLYSVFGNKLKKIDKSLDENGFRYLFIMRVTVVFPFDPLSYMAGMSTMRFRPFIVATMLGAIPETIAFNYLGMGLKNIPIYYLIAILCVGIIVFIAGKQIKNYICNRKK
ncbi:MAG: TVP38/TMEM64 family protein [Clostridium sp.]